MQGSDLKERLRAHVDMKIDDNLSYIRTADDLLLEAASEIERLEAEQREIIRGGEVLAAAQNAIVHAVWDLLGGEDPTRADGQNLVARVREVVAQRDQLAALVEQAFRDGLAYASNVVVTDPDLAWGHSKVRAALSLLEQKA